MFRKGDLVQPTHPWEKARCGKGRVVDISCQDREDDPGVMVKFNESSFPFPRRLKRWFPPSTLELVEKGAKE